MADSHNHAEQLRVADRVDDSVPADPYPIALGMTKVSGGT